MNNNFDPNTGQPIQQPMYNPNFGQPTVPVQQYVQPVMKPAPKRSNPAVVVIIVLIFLVVMGFVGYSVYKKVEEDSQAKELFVGRWVCGSSDSDFENKDELIQYYFDKDYTFTAYLPENSTGILKLSGTFKVTDTVSKGSGDIKSTNYTVIMTADEANFEELETKKVNEYEIAIPDDNKDEMIMMNVKSYSIAYCKRK